MSETNNPPEDPQENGQGNGNPEEVGVAMSLEEYEAIQNELETAKIEAAKNLDGWQRALADYNNLRRRTEQERELMRAELVGKIIAPFLDVLDDLELAVRNRPESSSEDGWGEGIALVYRKLLGKLESQGIQAMQAEGQLFDPHFHEAITHEQTSDIESGHVIAVVKPGYMIGDRVLRPAMVRVAA